MSYCCDPQERSTCILVAFGVYVVAVVAGLVVLVNGEMVRIAVVVMIVAVVMSAAVVMRMVVVMRMLVRVVTVVVVEIPVTVAALMTLMTVVDAPISRVAAAVVQGLELLVGVDGRVAAHRVCDLFEHYHLVDVHARFVSFSAKWPDLEPGGGDILPLEVAFFYSDASADECPADLGEDDVENSFEFCASK